MKVVSDFLKDVSNLSAPYLLAISVATGVCLFAPQAFLESIGFGKAVDDFRWVFGTLFLLTSSYLAALASWAIKDLSVAALVKRQKKLVRIISLKELTPQEQAYLVAYIDDDANTDLFELEDGIIGGLAAKGILYQSSKVFDLVEGVPWNMHPWAKRYLKEHPELLNKGRELKAVSPRNWKYAI